MRRILPFGLCLLAAACSAQAADPAWWTDTDTRIISVTETENNYAPVTLGQLKHVAKQAAEHLDEALAEVGGAGPQITAMIAQFEPRAGVTYTPEQLTQISKNNHSPANLGQLKNISKPFYDRLIAIGYDTKANLIARQYSPTWPSDYPWMPETLQEANYVPANLGQLKMIFSFSLAGFGVTAVDSDADGLSDEWEVDNGLDPHDATGDNGPHGDLDNDGISNGSEFTGNTNPNGPPPDANDIDGDGMVDTTEAGRGKVIGPKDHPDPKLRITIISQ